MNKIKILSLSISLFISIGVFSQIPAGFSFPSGVDVSGATKADIPSNIDVNKIKASEVPSEYQGKLAELQGKTDNDGSSNTDANSEKVEDGKAEETVSDKSEGSDTGAQTGYPIAKVYGKNIFRNSNIQYFEKATDVIAPDNYVIGDGDKLSVQVWGFSDYSGVFTVNERGYISPKLIGRVYLKDLTFGQAKSLLKSKFGQIMNLSSSEIDITLTYSRINTVNIVGEVFKPGSYKIPAINTAFNAMVVAKGPNEIGSVREIYIKRGGKIVDKLDVYDFLMNPNSNKDVYLQNGDYLFVPVAKKVVDIKGEVKREFAYELKDNENLMSLLKYAGGLKKSAYKRTIKIKRFKGTEQVLLDINLDELLINKKDFVLEDNDQIFIPQIPEVIVNTVKIVGSVKVPGEYELDSLIRVSDLITKSEGVIFDAYLDRAYLYRLNPDLTRAVYPINLSNIINNLNDKDNIYLQPYDEIHVISKASFADDFKINISGAVRKPQSILFGNGMTLRDALMFSGGLEPRAANNRIEVSRIFSTNSNNLAEPIRTIIKSFAISNDLYIDKQAESFLLEPRDQIIVRANPDYEVQQNVTIKGAVFYPGTYTLLSKDEKISDLIARAGGLKSFAFPDGSSMEREGTGSIYLNLKKAIANQNSKSNIVLEAGDYINIPKTLDLVIIKGDIGNINQEAISGPLVTGKRAGYYVRNYAGGFGNNAKKSKTLVIYPNGRQRTTTNLFFNIHPRVKPGSQIYVRSKIAKEEKVEGKKIDWNTVIENITVKLTAIATFWILIDRVTK